MIGSKSRHSSVFTIVTIASVSVIAVSSLSADVGPARLLGGGDVAARFEGGGFELRGAVSGAVGDGPLVGTELTLEGRLLHSETRLAEAQATRRRGSGGALTRRMRVAFVGEGTLLDHAPAFVIPLDSADVPSLHELDIDRDGRLDLVALDRLGSSLSLFARRADGRFEAWIGLRDQEARQRVIDDLAEGRTLFDPESQDETRRELNESEKDSRTSEDQRDHAVAARRLAEVVRAVERLAPPSEERAKAVLVDLQDVNADGCIDAIVDDDELDARLVVYGNGPDDVASFE